MADFDYKSAYQKYINILKEKAKKEVKKAQDKSIEEFFKHVEKELIVMYEETILDFYLDYTPKYYSRTGELYNLLHIRTGKRYIEAAFNPSAITSRTGYSQENGLYNTVFREGWHGGALHKEEMLYRKPVPYYTSWGRPAERATVSPLYDFRNRVYTYLKTDYQKDYKRIWDKNKSQIKI